MKALCVGITDILKWVGIEESELSEMNEVSCNTISDSPDSGLSVLLNI